MGRLFVLYQPGFQLVVQYKLEVINSPYAHRPDVLRDDT
jgi:hypothetical protein